MPLLNFRKPDEADLARFVQAQRALPVTYRGGLKPQPGFAFRRTQGLLGSGAQRFERAVEGLEAWAVYPAWLTPYPRPAPVQEGTCVALLAGFACVWTVSAVRVVAVERDARRFSLRLGTLPQHALTGLEHFTVSLDDTEAVWYEILALSKPRHPLVRVGAPVLRLVQWRFARDSVRSLRQFVER